MEPYRLASLYAELRNAANKGDQSTAISLLSEALGCQLPRDVTPISADRCTTRLSYRGFKPAELAMLAANLKPVVKFEDVPSKAADQFVERYGQHYQLVRGPQYYKDYLTLRSRRAPLRGEVPMTFIYASRDDAGERLRTLEHDHPDAIEKAGELLGFPACCSAAFARTFAISRNDQDALNDDAVYALLQATMQTPGMKELDPLSDLDLLAFYPCTPRCAHAAAFADRTLAALQQSAPVQAAEAISTLGAPILYWRMPFFIVFDGEAIAGAPATIHYRHARVHVFPDPAVARLQRLFAGLILPLLDRGDQLTMEAGDVVIRAQGAEVGRLRRQGDRSPVLGVWV